MRLQPRVPACHCSPLPSRCCLICLRWRRCCRARVRCRKLRPACHFFCCSGPRWCCCFCRRDSHFLSLCITTPFSPPSVPPLLLSLIPLKSSPSSRSRLRRSLHPPAFAFLFYELRMPACGAFPLSPLPFSPFLCFIDNKRHACLRRVSSLPTALFPCPLLH